MRASGAAVWDPLRISGGSTFEEESREFVCLSGAHPSVRELLLGLSIFCVSVDAMLPVPHHHSLMRRFWLTILSAFSLAFGGAANAWAAQACPYTASSASAHDCCPDGMMKGKSGEHPAKKPADCQLGQSCRASIAVAASLPSLKVVVVIPARTTRAPTDADDPPARSFSFWRPPRTV
jgi:hypothetical protein